MAKAPVVRDLNGLIKTIGQSIQPQMKLIDADIAANEKSGKAQIAGLGAQKDQAFSDIEQAASDKGMYFAGFSPDEQAKYTAGTYLPALAQLQATIAATRSQLLGKKADLNTSVFNQAFQTREGDISRKFTWDQAQADRDFQAKENAADRAAAAANAAAQGAASAQAAYDADRKGVAKDLQNVAGGDGFVSPTDWKKLRNQWVSSGYSADSFTKYFGGFRNTTYGTWKKDYK